MNKKKMLSAFLMLLITAIALTTASYAWFTENTTVTLDDIDVTVSSANGIQISTDGITWNASISNANITTGYNVTGDVGGVSTTVTSKNQLPSGTNQMVPVSTGGQVITAAGETKGQLAMYKGAIVVHNGNNVLTSEADFETAGNSGDFVAFDMFIRVDQAETLKLAPTSAVTLRSGNAGLENSARVAFINEGNVNNGSAQIDIVRQNSGTTAVIWEPNNNFHTANAISNNLSINHTNIAANAVIASYPGFYAPFTTASAVPLNATDTGDYADLLETVTPDIATGTTFGATAQDIMPLTAGISKIRVYMWVEGQDIDCENQGSGSGIRFSIALTK